MHILSIDPGSTESGFVVFDTKASKVISFGKIPNQEVLKKEFCQDLTLIEKPDFISIGAGSTVIEAIFWAGRFKQFFKGSITYGRSYLKRSYKLANDSKVIEFIKKSYPGIRLTKDSWQAMLLVHAYRDNLINTETKVKKPKKKKKEKEFNVNDVLF